MANFIIPCHPSRGATGPGTHQPFLMLAAIIDIGLDAFLVPYPPQLRTLAGPAAKDEAKQSVIDEVRKGVRSVIKGLFD